MLSASILILVGFIVLIWSADLLVDNASVLGHRLGVSTFLIGIVVIGFGTSAPEMVVSAIAAFEGKGNLALGNALGSNITNIGLVLGGAALIRAVPVDKGAIKLDIPIMIAMGLLAVALVLDHTLNRYDGIILLLILFAYLAWTAKTSKIAPLQEVEQGQSTTKKSTLLVCLLSVVSIVLLIIASRLLVKGAVTIATLLNISELIIGLSVVAIGTSLPELAAAIAAARKNQNDMLIGNIIGSNIFNTLGVIGIAGVIKSTSIDINAVLRDFPAMLFISGLMLLFAFSRRTVSRFEGGVLLACYFAYIYYLVQIATI